MLVWGQNWYCNHIKAVQVASYIAESKKIQLVSVASDKSFTVGYVLAYHE